MAKAFKLKKPKKPAPLRNPERCKPSQLQAYGRKMDKYHEEMAVYNEKKREHEALVSAVIKGQQGLHGIDGLGKTKGRKSSGTRKSKLW